MSVAAAYRRLQDGESIRRREPLHVEPATPPVFAAEAATYTHSPEAGVYRIAKGYLDQSGTAHDAFARRVPWNRISEPAGRKEAGLPWNPKVWTRRHFRVGGRIGALTHPRQKGYFHWLFDVLPRLALVEAAGAEMDCFYIDQSQDFQRQCWSRLGAKAKVIDASEHRDIRAAEILIPSAPSTSGVMPRWVCDWLRTRLGAPGPSDRCNLRLYVSRSIVGTGRVENEDSVRVCLERRGFTTVNCEQMPVNDQIALFSRAEVVLGPHGAGLSNVVFSNPQCTVVELFTDTYVNVCYWTLCCQLEMRYALLLADAIPGKGGPGRPDLCVDLNKLNRLLDHLGIHTGERID